MYKKLFTLILVLVFVCSTYGDEYWDGEAGDGHWTSSLNWTGNAVPAYGENASVWNTGVNPVYIHSGQTGNAGVVVIGWTGQTNKLVIDGGTLNVSSYFEPGWHDGSNGQLEISSGSLNIDTMDLVLGNMGSGTLTMTGGVIDMKSSMFGLQIGSPFNGKSGDESNLLNLWGGTIYVRVSGPSFGLGLVMSGVGMEGICAAENYGKTARIDVTGGKMILDDIDGSVRDRIQGYINNGWIYSTDAELTPQVAWDGVGLTTLQAIPEPITIALFGLGSLALRRILRK